MFNTLVARLGESSVFMDVDSVALGRDFRQVLQESLASCDLVLVIIGRDWLDAKSGSGQRRIEDPEDFVHLEIGVALKRNIPITPVLVQRAEMPTAQHLPHGIKDFAYRNGFELSHNRWESDVQELLKRLGVGKQPVPEARTETDPPAVRTHGGRTSRQWLVIGGTVIVLVGSLGAGLRYYTSSSDDKKPPATDGARIDFDPPARSGSGIVLTPALRAEYQKLFASTRIRPGRVQAVDTAIDTIASNRARYQKVQDETRVPWQVVGMIHYVEASFNFTRHLHNGDPLAARTVNVPAGRPKSGDPPFTWEESAIDFMRYLNLADTPWNVADTLYAIERVNGMGYRSSHPEVLSPYLWVGRITIREASTWLTVSSRRPPCHSRSA